MKKMLMLVVSMMFCVANVNAQNSDDAPIIELLSPTSYTSTTYNLRVGIKSRSQIQSISFSINGGDLRDVNAVSRGVNAVVNDGYSHILSQTVNLSDGDNTIRVFAKNASFLAMRDFTVYVGQQNTPTASIEKVWSDVNVMQDGKKGMMIHVKFDTKRMKGIEGKCIVYFYNGDKSKMPYTLSGYKTYGGYACSSRRFIPSYDYATFQDFDIFVPYDALKVVMGGNTYYYRVQIYDNNHNFLTSSEYFPFTTKRKDKRVALVIGNQNYKTDSPFDVLHTPINDANDVASKLKTLGFDVTLRTDLTGTGFASVFNDFKYKANNSDVALIYYAGHGMEIDGANYLMPVDVTSICGDDQGVPLNLQDIMSGANKKIVILDACRTSCRGMAVLKPISMQNSIIAFSTSEGKSANDVGSNGRNSPYAIAFLNALSNKGWTLNNIFQYIAGNIRGQRPVYKSTMYEDVILNK